MRCQRCQRIQSHTTKVDPETCRAHLATFVDAARAAENRIDCWRTQMHTKALRCGLQAQVELVDRLIIDDKAPIRPMVVVVPNVPESANPPMEQREDRTWRRPDVVSFDVRMFVHVGDREFVDGFRAHVEDAAQELVNRIDEMVERAGALIAREGVRWAS